MSFPDGTGTNRAEHPGRGALGTEVLGLQARDCILTWRSVKDSLCTCFCVPLTQRKKRTDRGKEEDRQTETMPPTHALLCKEVKRFPKPLTDLRSFHPHNHQVQELLQFLCTDQKTGAQEGKVPDPQPLDVGPGTHAGLQTLSAVWSLAARTPLAPWTTGDSEK